MQPVAGMESEAAATTAAPGVGLATAVEWRRAGAGDGDLDSRMSLRSMSSAPLPPDGNDEGRAREGPATALSLVRALLRGVSLTASSSSSPSLPRLRLARRELV